MNIRARTWVKEDLRQMLEIWNEVVRAGNAFPQMEELDAQSGAKFFAEQSLCRVAENNDGEICGLYILHPNNIGRCGHIANASYAAAKNARGMGIGRLLVEDSLRQAKTLGFRILQFNAVVKSNERALRLYESLGFQPLGYIPGGFLSKDGIYEDICLFYHPL